MIRVLDLFSGIGGFRNTLTLAYLAKRGELAGPCHPDPSSTSGKPREWCTPQASIGDAGTQSRGGKRKGEKLLTGQVQEAESSGGLTLSGIGDSTLPRDQRTTASRTGDASRKMAHTGGAENAPLGPASDPSRESAIRSSRGQLNPDWVQQLQGFPDGWTDTF